MRVEKAEPTAAKRYSEADTIDAERQADECYVGRESTFVLIEVIIILRTHKILGAEVGNKVRVSSWVVGRSAALPRELERTRLMTLEEYAARS